MARSQRNEKLPPSSYIPSPEEQLIWAAYTGQTAEVERLKELPQAKTYLDNAGNTALIRAAMGNHNDAFMILLKEGFDPTVANSRGNTCLHFFCKHGNRAGIEILHELNAPLSPRNKLGASPLRWCKMYTQKDARALMESLDAIDYPERD